jgi:hypothetical protein
MTFLCTGVCRCLSAGEDFLYVFEDFLYVFKPGRERLGRAAACSG